MNIYVLLQDDIQRPLQEDSHASDKPGRCLTRTAISRAGHGSAQQKMGISTTIKLSTPSMAPGPVAAQEILKQLLIILAIISSIICGLFLLLYLLHTALPRLHFSSLPQCSKACPLTNLVVQSMTRRPSMPQRPNLTISALGTVWRARRRTRRSGPLPTTAQRRRNRRLPPTRKRELKRTTPPWGLWVLGMAARRNGLVRLQFMGVHRVATPSDCPPDPSKSLKVTNDVLAGF